MRGLRQRRPDRPCHDIMALPRHMNRHHDASAAQRFQVGLTAAEDENSGLRAAGDKNSGLRATGDENVGAYVVSTFGVNLLC